LILPFLEALMEGSFWNLPEFGCNVLHGCQMCPLEAHFQRREQPKVTQSEIRKVQWMGDNRNIFLGKESLHNKQYVA
jgi:hypothetical protein